MQSKSLIPLLYMSFANRVVGINLWPRRAIQICSWNPKGNALGQKKYLLPEWMEKSCESIYPCSRSSLTCPTNLKFCVGFQLSWVYRSLVWSSGFGAVATTPHPSTLPQEPHPGNTWASARALDSSHNYQPVASYCCFFCSIWTFKGVYLLFTEFVPQH